MIINRFIYPTFQCSAVGIFLEWNKNRGLEVDISRFLLDEGLAVLFLWPMLPTWVLIQSVDIAKENTNALQKFDEEKMSGPTPVWGWYVTN